MVCTHSGQELYLCVLCRRRAHLVYTLVYGRIPDDTLASTHRERDEAALAELDAIKEPEE